jgi:dTDP-4-amino-4,6-dideoxygalactose transaminase
VRPDTLNLDESLLDAALTERTRAILPVHYAGVSAEMDAILAFAERNQLFVIEDAAQGVLATYRGRQLGTMGNAGCLSFHETKNLISGEGGALLLRDEELVERAEILREKGTNRSAFFRGEVDKYTWIDVGSSFLPSELTAAFLWSQFEAADELTARRLATWHRYWSSLAEAEEAGLLRRPVVPPHVGQNGHSFYVLCRSSAARAAAIAASRSAGFHAVFHYVPLHSSPAGRKYGRTSGELTVTDDVAERVLRLPVWVGLAETEIEALCAVLSRALERAR